jgi:hypothetical protein
MGHETAWSWCYNTNQDNKKSIKNKLKQINSIKKQKTNIS